MRPELRPVRQIDIGLDRPETEEEFPPGVQNRGLRGKFREVGHLQRLTQLGSDIAPIFLRLFHRQQHAIGIIQRFLHLQVHGPRQSRLRPERSLQLVLIILLHHADRRKPKQRDQDDTRQLDPHRQRIRMQRPLPGQRRLRRRIHQHSLLWGNSQYLDC